MTNLKIEPSRLKGTVTIPPSKSMAHRAVICSSLANGRSTIKNIQLSDDIKATIEGMRSFGAVILEEGNTLTIDGIVRGTERRDQVVDCNESGSTLRFLIPLATLVEGQTRFVGRGKLGTRPLDTYQEIFAKQGVRYEPSETEELDLRIDGQLQSGAYDMRGDVSSQFITGMLLTLPLLDGESTLSITTELESKGYVDLTLSILETFGIKITHDENYHEFKIQGNQTYLPQEYTVEGDYSQAAFFLSAGALGSDTTVTGLNEVSLQGDKAIVQILRNLGANLTNTEQGLKVEKTGKLEANGEIDGSQCPDIIPVATLAAALSEGTTKITNLERLRIKESDRLTATQKELSALGAQIKVVGDSLHITGVAHLEGGVSVWSHKDHRMAMMLAIASTVCKKSIILKDTECVAKSYPNFWQEFEALGGKISEWNLG